MSSILMNGLIQFLHCRDSFHLGYECNFDYASIFYTFSCYEDQVHSFFLEEENFPF